MKGRHVELASKERPWILNKRFGKLTVVQFIKIDDKGNDYWSVKCDCGYRRNMMGYTIRHFGRSSCGHCKPTVVKENIVIRLLNNFLFKNNEVSA
jgi:hypothetical protein